MVDNDSLGCNTPRLAIWKHYRSRHSSKSLSNRNTLSRIGSECVSRDAAHDRYIGVECSEPVVRVNNGDQLTHVTGFDRLWKCEWCSAI
jgi:hypothetical protein